MVKSESEKKAVVLKQKYDDQVAVVEKAYIKASGIAKLECDVNKCIRAANRSMKKAKGLWKAHPAVDLRYDYTLSREFGEKREWFATPEYSEKLETEIKRLSRLHTVEVTVLRDKEEAAILAIELSGVELDVATLIVNLDLTFDSDLSSHITGLLA
jgi:hypothetical protein